VVGYDMEPWSAGLYAVACGRLLPPASAADYAECLLRNLREDQARILLPGSDPELPFLARAREAFLAAGVIPIVGSPEAVRLCRDKLAAYRFFERHGLPFVRTAPAREGLALAREVGFPVIVKPVGGSASRHVAVVFSEEELRPHLDQEDLIVQEYLVPEAWGVSRRDLGREDVLTNHKLRQEDEVSIQVLFDHCGTHLGTFTSRNVLVDGVPMRIDPWPKAPVEPVAYEMARLLLEQGLVGPCNLQCKMTADGPRFFEINARFTGITAVRAAMGFNEVEALLLRALLDEPVEAVRERLRVPEDLVCSRFITELLFSRANLERLRENGAVEGEARSTSL
jgi:carbamoylphosphate synthase large subunit